MKTGKLGVPNTRSMEAVMVGGVVVAVEIVLVEQEDGQSSRHHFVVCAFPFLFGVFSHLLHQGQMP